MLDYAARGLLQTPFLSLSDDLSELTDLFSGYWRRIVSLTQTSSIAFPFSRLHNEPFWKLVPAENVTLSSSLINNVASVSGLCQICAGARIEVDLHTLISVPEPRQRLARALLDSCFSEGSIRACGSSFTARRGIPVQP